MAFAKLLRDENIEHVINIKYKSPYKIFIQFDDKSQAEKLINCSKLSELDIRAQFTDQGNLSYGLIKGVDLDMDESEIMQSLSSEEHIISIKRLKRVDFEGKWIDSETVRICFKSATCPDYVNAYGYRFTVERYVFPVTQCSGCWQFGHIKRFCPTNKCLCPKCGKSHENCDAKRFTCINCKGPHMALDKTCPRFQKEKKLRILMSEENISYKNALELYMQKYKKISICQHDFPPLPPTLNNNIAVDSQTEPIPVSYQDNLFKNISEQPNDEGLEKQPQGRDASTKKIRRSVSVESMEYEDYPDDYREKNKKCENREEEGKKKEDGEKDYKGDKRRKLEWTVIWKRLKDIAFSNDLLEEKMLNLVKYLFDELSSFVVNLFADGELLKRMFRHSFECS